MVEGVVRFSAELQRKALVDLRVLVDGHIPNVDAGSRDGIPAGSGKCTKLRLYETGAGVFSHVTHQVGIIWSSVASVAEVCARGIRGDYSGRAARS